MGLLLGYEKTAGIQAAQNCRKKRLRPLLISERLGLQDTALTELQFLEGPPLAGFLFVKS